MSTFVKAGFWEKLCKPCKGYKGWLNLDEFVTNIVTALIPPVPTSTYKVFTALVTQNGGNIIQQLNGGYLSIGTTYKIIHAGLIPGDFTNVGAPNNDDNTMFIATGSIPNNWGTSFVEYNVGAPVATVLENTIGNIWFNFEVDGVYSMQSNGLFSTEKTVGFITYNDGGPSGLNDKPFLSIYPNNDYNIYVNSALNGVVSNDVLFYAPIEIRVYN